MRTLVYLFLFSIPMFAFSQQTYFSTSDLGATDWDDPQTWTLDSSSVLTPINPPTINDHVVIRHYVYQDAGLDYTHFGNVWIEKQGTFEIMTGTDISDPYYFAGDSFVVEGNLITSSDFQHQRKGTGENGVLIFGPEGDVDIGDDLILNAQGRLEMDNICGTGFTFDDIYFVGSGARVCGEGRFVVPHQIRVWDDSDLELSNNVKNTLPPAPLTEAAKAQLVFQICQGFSFYNEQVDCSSSTNEIIEGEGDDGTFPVEYLDYKVQVQDEQIEIRWVTARETNNNFFTIERSSDAVHFEEIGTVQGAGTSLIPLSYRLRDQNPPRGRLYYRLKQTDFDGSTSYARVASVLLDPGVFHIYIRNNPHNEKQEAFVTGLSPYSPVNFQLMNLEGKILNDQQVRANHGGEAFITIPQEKYPGIIILNCATANHRAYKKLFNP